jgi:amino acid transporter
MVGILLTANSLAQFARILPSAGSFVTYLTTSFGPRSGTVLGTFSSSATPRRPGRSIPCWAAGHPMCCIEILDYRLTGPSLWSCSSSWLPCCWSSA